MSDPILYCAADIFRAEMGFGPEDLGTGATESAFHRVRQPRSTTMAMTQSGKGPTPSTTPKTPLTRETPEQYAERQRVAEEIEKNPHKAGATPSDSEKALPQNHPNKGDKPNPDHADQPGSGQSGAGERDGRGEVFDQDRSPKGIDYAGERSPNTDPYSGSIEDKRNLG